MKLFDCDSHTFWPLYLAMHSLATLLKNNGDKNNKPQGKARASIRELVDKKKLRIFHMVAVDGISPPARLVF